MKYLDKLNLVSKLEANSLSNISKIKGISEVKANKHTTDNPDFLTKEAIIKPIDI